MRWVPQAAGRPHRCAVIPFIGNHSAKMGFIDTGQVLPGWDPHVYISGEAVREMAAIYGLIPVHEKQRIMQVIERQDNEIKALKAELADKREQLDAIGLLKRAGVVSNKGRPPGKSKSKPKAAA